MKFLNEKFKIDRSKVYTQSELAEKTGIKFEVIKNIEVGRKNIFLDAGKEEFELMCNAIGVNPKDYIARDTKVITFLSNKGGSAKTSACIGISYSLATKYDKKCLVIDTDLQLNLTQGFGMQPDDSKNFYKAFVTEDDDIRNHIRPTAYNNIDIVTSHENMSVMEDAIATVKFKEYKMQYLLNGLIDSCDYDYILIDCNPSLGGVNISCLMVTDGLIIPVIPSTFGEKGLAIMANTFKSISAKSKKLNLLGVMLNRLDGRKGAKYIIQNVKENFGKDSVIFKTCIPEDAKVDHSQREYEPLGYAFPASRAAIAFDEISQEVIDRANKL